MRERTEMVGRREEEQGEERKEWRRRWGLRGGGKKQRSVVFKSL